MLEKDEKVGWTDRVRNEGILQIDKEEWNIVQTIKGLTVFVTSVEELPSKALY